MGEDGLAVALDIQSGRREDASRVLVARRNLEIEPIVGRIAGRLARTAYEYSMSGKWLELLKEIAPRVTRVAVLRDSGRAGADDPQRY